MTLFKKKLITIQHKPNPPLACRFHHNTSQHCFYALQKNPLLTSLSQLAVHPYFKRFRTRFNQNNSTNSFFTLHLSQPHLPHTRDSPFKFIFPQAWLQIFTRWYHLLKPYQTKEVSIRISGCTHVQVNEEYNENDKKIHDLAIKCKVCTWL